MNAGDARAMVWAIRTIADLHQIRPVEVPVLLVTWWQAWESHEVFEWYYGAGERQFRLWNPVVMAAFRHEPGAGGRTLSYVVGNVQDCVTSIDWGERSYGGKFYAMLPIRAGIYPSRTNIMALSFSYHGAGGAWRARMMLKALLPPTLHRYVSLARKFNSRPKRHMVPISEEEAQTKPASWLPPAYRRLSKAELFFQEIVADEDKALLRDYIEPVVFWKCATGRVNPEEVADHIIHQPDLFGERVSRARGRRGGWRGPRERQAVEAEEGQLALL